ncbi:Gfo/Idh/MocA family oxidoreductase [Actinomycetes bacterium KLBMP 9759]
MADRARIGVVGAGTITQSVHLPVITRLGGVLELRAVHDLSAARTAEVAAAYGARPCGSIEEVLTAPDVDAVLIATPGSHPGPARAALLAGKHVLAEKPLCLTVAEADELAALAERTGLVLQVGYMKMWDPAVRITADELAGLGAPVAVHVTVLHPADAAQVGHLRMAAHTDVDPTVVDAARATDLAAAARAVGDEPELARWYANVLNGSVVHELSVLRALGIALPARFASCDVWTGVEGEPPSVVATAHAGATRLTLTWLWVPRHPGYEEEITIVTRDGQVRIDVAPPYLVDATSTVQVRSSADDGAARRSTRIRDGSASGFLAQWEGFARAITGDGGPTVAGADAAGVAADLRCLQALAARAAAERGWALGGEAAAAR